ncbi:MAG: hypothetical protein RL354_805 [Planctomycetota bacterium]
MIPPMLLHAIQLSVLLASSCLAFQDGAAKPADRDILKGPDVPQETLKPERERAKKVDAPVKQSRPMLEQRVLFMSLDGLALDQPTRAKVNAIRDEFAASVQAYEKDAEVKRKEIFEKRKKSAEPGKPPSEEFKKAMEELEAKRPKLGDLKAKLAAVLTKEQLEELRTSFEEGLKRARAELTRREEEARKQKEAERKSGEKPRDNAGEKGRESAPEMDRAN